MDVNALITADTDTNSMPGSQLVFTNKYELFLYIFLLLCLRF